MRQILSLVMLVGFSVGVIAQPVTGYYDAADTSSAQALRNSLHEIIDDHTRFPYTSSDTDTWDVLEIADENPDDSDQVITIYRNASFIKRGGGNDFYNREHTWPKSYGFPDNGPELNYPYTDMHHLFLSDGDYNFSRSNKPLSTATQAVLKKSLIPIMKEVVSGVLTPGIPTGRMVHSRRDAGKHGWAVVGT